MTNAIEAAKRILDTPDISFDGVTVHSVESADAKIVAAAYLREHQSDDDELLELGWYYECGAREYIGPPGCLENQATTRILGMETLVGLYLWITIDRQGKAIAMLGRNCWIALKTRGDVRRLCTALGIETKATVTA